MLLVFVKSDWCWSLLAWWTLCCMHEVEVVEAVIFLFGEELLSKLLVFVSFNFFWKTYVSVCVSCFVGIGGIGLTWCNFGNGDR